MAHWCAQSLFEYAVDGCWYKRFGNSGIWIEISDFDFLYKTWNLLYHHCIKSTIGSSHQFMYINEFGVQMTCVSSLSFHPARSRNYQVSWSFWLLKLPWGTTHSLRPEGPEWTMWASWHAVTASSSHVWQMLQELFLPSNCFLLEALQSNAN